VWRRARPWQASEPNNPTAQLLVINPATTGRATSRAADLGKTGGKNLKKKNNITDHGNSKMEFFMFFLFFFFYFYRVMFSRPPSIIFMGFCS
jgi:hypothetical protein